METLRNVYIWLQTKSSVKSPLLVFSLLGKSKRGAGVLFIAPNNPQSSMNNLKAPISSCTFRGIPKVLMRFTL